MTAEAFRRQLEAIQTQFRRDLPDKLAEIDGLWRELASGALESARMADLQRELHTLAGSGTTFGVAGLSDAAAAAESFLEPYCAQCTLLDPTGRAEFRRLLDALMRAAGSR